MTRVVRASDGRTWAVRRTVNWIEPSDGQEFEHDVAAGRISGLAMLLIVVILVVTVVLWTPPAVVVPSWLVLLFLAVLLVLPLQWATNRSWTIVAETPELPELDMPPERWVGYVQGMMVARREARRVARSLQSDSAVPNDGNGRLQLVN